MAEHNARLNKLVANFGDIEARRKLIAEFGNSDSAFMGENQNREDIMISIAQTGIIEKVWQRNGKLRVDEYNKDGFFVSQKYEGD